MEKGLEKDTKRTISGEKELVNGSNDLLLKSIKEQNDLN